MEDETPWIKIGDNLEWDEETGLVIIYKGNKDKGVFVRDNQYYLVFIRDEEKKLEINHPMAIEMDINDKHYGCYLLLPQLWIEEDSSLWIEPIEVVREHWGLDKSLVFEHIKSVTIKDWDDEEEEIKVIQQAIYDLSIGSEGSLEHSPDATEDGDEELDEEYNIHIHIKPEFASEIKGDENTYLYNISLYYEEWDGGLLVIGSHPPMWWNEGDIGQDLLEFVCEYHCLEPEWIRKIDVKNE